METDMWILATSSSLADADLPWINPIAIAVAVLLIITAAYFVVKAHIDKKLAKEREAMIRSQQEQELKTAQNKIRFLTNVSQQLFTPLTLIYAPVNELLRRTRDSRDPVPTHDAYCLSEIERNSLRLIRLIEQQLDYEKLDQGQLTLQIGPSDIIPRIRNVINGFNRISGEKNIDIHLDCPYDSLVLPVDSDKLEKIAANLIGHTLKNIRPNATVWIELRVTVEPDSIFGLKGIHDKYLQINIIDNGSLLSEENLSHLFERYRRAGKEEIQNEFGIDLHYVKKLTELHSHRATAPDGRHGIQRHSPGRPIRQVFTPEFGSGFVPARIESSATAGRGRQRGEDPGSNDSGRRRRSGARSVPPNDPDAELPDRYGDRRPTGIRKDRRDPPESDRMRPESGFEDVRLVQKDERQRPYGPHPRHSAAISDRNGWSDRGL